MENFIVSARKYRPTTFDSVVGQQAITQTLRNAIRNNHLAQALLFCGPRGVGKTTCARILAKAINLSDQNDNVALQNNEEDFAFNIFELDAASNNSVEDIRSLIDQVRFPPQIGKFKVYIIDEVHMLSQSAFNAFLKTLEEPPKHAIFILATTEKHKIIPTILSRCQVFDFNRIQVDDIANHLAGIAEKEGIEAEADALHVIARKADGALRDALSMFDQIVSYAGNRLTYKSAIDNLNILDYDYYFKVTDALITSNIPQALLIFNEILVHGFDGHNFIVGLEQHFRNLIVCQDPSTLQLLEAGATIRDKYKVQAEQCPRDLLLQALTICNQCDIEYKNSKNQRLLVELTLMQLCSLTQNSQASITTKKKASPIAPPDPEQRAQTPPVSADPVAPPPVVPVERSQPQPQKEEPVMHQAEKQATGLEDRQAVVSPRHSTATEPAPEQAPAAASGKEPVTPVRLQNNPLKGKLSSSFSISSFVEERQEKYEAAGADAAEDNLPREKYSEEAFMAIWKEMAQKADEEGNYTLLSILNKEPLLLENFQVSLILDNKAQAEEFEAEKMSIQERLRSALNNYKINITISINKEEAKKKAYTAAEKFNKMAEKNPHLNTLRDQLGLEINL